MRPAELLYSKEHEWVRQDDGDVVVGITDHAAEELGEIVFIELPEVGATVTAGESMGTIETVKAVEELYAPVSGTVAAVNDALADQPELVNGSPYEDGWFVRIEGADPASAGLMDAAAYDAMIGG